jgi:hypothetical protein
MFSLAFDKNTKRRIDDNGFLHVSGSHISKEVVNPYMGSEIPGFEELGLAGDKMYSCYRKGSELRAAADSFNGLPILLGHFAESADDPQKDKRIGSMGTDAKFTKPFLDNSLIFTDQNAIDKIESGEIKELSCSYRWVPVVQSGTFDGAAYDIIMTQIRGNHLGLVPEGRAGSDVMVHDSKPEAVMAYDTDPELEKQENVLIEEMQGIVEKFKQIHKKEEKVMEKEGKAMDGAGLKEAYDAMSEDGKEEFLKMIGKKKDKAEDEDPEEKEAEDAKDEEAEKKKAADMEEEKKAKDMEEKKSDDKAMDEKIKLAKDEAIAEVTAKHKALSDAAADVRTVIGNIDALSFDSADAIYGKALDLQKVPTKGFEPSAYKGMFAVHKMNQRSAVVLASDASTTELSGHFAGLKNVKVS